MNPINSRVHQFIQFVQYFRVSMLKSRDVCIQFMVNCAKHFDGNHFTEELSLR